MIRMQIVLRSRRFPSSIPQVRAMPGILTASQNHFTAHTCNFPSALLVSSSRPSGRNPPPFGVKFG